MVIPFFIFSNIVQLFYDKMQRKITCKQIQSMLYLLYTSLNYMLQGGKDE